MIKHISTTQAVMLIVTEVIHWEKSVLNLKLEITSSEDCF